MPFLAGLDLSLNHSAGQTNWSAHWCGFTIDRDCLTLRRDLRKFFQSSELVRRPVLVRAVKRTPDRAFSYGLKAVFDERFSAAPGNPPFASAVITPAHDRFVGLMRFLDRIGLMDRVYAQNIDTNLPSQLSHRASLSHARALTILLMYKRQYD